MPGKVNPTQCEAMTMLCAQVFGNDVAINFGGAAANSRLTVFADGGAQLFAKRAPAGRWHGQLQRPLRVGIAPPRNALRAGGPDRLMLVTALNPHIGYDKAASSPKSCIKRHRTARRAYAAAMWTASSWTVGGAGADGQYFYIPKKAPAGGFGFGCCVVAALGGGHGLGYFFVQHVAGAADVQLGLGLFLRFGLQVLLQLGVADGLAVPVVAAVREDGQLEWVCALAVLGLTLVSAWPSPRSPECFITGTVMMKMMSSPSMTSTSGVMLISFITCIGFVLVPKAMVRHLSSAGSPYAAGFFRCRCAACAGHKEGMQIVCEAVQAVEHAILLPRTSAFCSQQRRGWRRPGQRCVLISASPIGPATLVDGHDGAIRQWPQRVVVCPDGAEQADEGRGGAHRCQHGQARLGAGGELVNAVAQAGRRVIQSLTSSESCRCSAVLRWGGGFAAFQRQLAEGVVGLLAQLVEPGGKVGAVPEVLGGARVLLVAHDVERLDDDDDPRCERHGDEDGRDKLGHEVSLGPDVGDTELRFHN
ncbi:hypothetical protein FQA39_LY19063 [Lamprigera yunnana]|nr:hypothetical protein FQA39_LY19063 [Lamprigera yunnana]